eukprot:TRINITY_DN35735_c0_g1_i1.p1 TRINITY_DN35735_c0_g1~~TRINITY_DN35735_c0_g1_i1.p1  ORF type:complete len:509 (-),score=169.77 TRINITY_DN35735_c0_g1_i1:319-1845(-)
MSCWIKVCLHERESPVEIETEDDGTILLENITALFPGATTLKYKTSEGTQRSVKCSGGVLKAPGGNWEAADKFLVVIPGAQEPRGGKSEASRGGQDPLQDQQRKRTYDELEYEQQQQRSSYDPGDMPSNKRSSSSNKSDENRPRDLIILGLSPATPLEKVREYFETYGEVAMLNPKKSKDPKVTYAFIRFKDKETERRVRHERHRLDDKDLDLRIPDSQTGDRDLRKMYVCYHNENLDKMDIRIFFEQFGDVSDVYIPQPFKHYCFVTFADVETAQDLMDTEKVMDDGTIFSIKAQTNAKKKMAEKAEMSNFSGFPFPVSQGGKDDRMMPDWPVIGGGGSQGNNFNQMSRPGGMNPGNNMMPPNMNPSMGPMNNMGGGGMNNMGGGGMNPMGGGMNNMGGGMGNMGGGGGMRPGNNGMGGGQSGGGMNPQQMNMFQNPYGGNLGNNMSNMQMPPPPSSMGGMMSGGGGAGGDRMSSNNQRMSGYGQSQFSQQYDNNMSNMERKYGSRV